ncbi:carbamoyltransferase HypF [Gordonia rhizosphera]|uniref:Carbamoyltransferase n=1 Tax=Gordonia rhizosphera NBRC 16068 TaxID=1108045 RepID=K6VWX2_9ACTN|nr:carbamoyltransferase HypF [Gordonia rhizosphera]GAB91400.1 NiFe-hydrogenase maturation protein HypF [Gordonia rhizosphera NBRC 16068]
MSAGRVRRRLVITGLVQGVGFRPFVYATAAELALTGGVRNDSSGVVIEIEGTASAAAEFSDRVRHRPPALAVVEDIVETPLRLRGGTGFTIDDSTHGTHGRTLVSPDVAICADCRAELRDPADRRHRHPFISCTNCGPRFTIVERMPYDRTNTSMADFPMCPRCAAEYSDPGDRRFHAQTVSCHDCGPVISYDGPDAEDRDPLTAARALLDRGGILAVKGIGGYHLACDANNERAVATLRRRKRRGDKPFAVMVAGLETARGLVATDAAADRLLCSPHAPIVIGPRSGAPVAASVAPGNPDLGVMLAYTPLHLLLFGLEEDHPGPQELVMTSGNLGGEPICYQPEQARERLAQIADGFLDHDRRIVVPCDDSVLRVVDGATMPIRRSRGYAPMPLVLPAPAPPMMATGADLKNTCAVAHGRYAWLSQHIGDMDDLATLNAFDAAERHLEAVTGVTPELLAVDAHPGYRSAAWARRTAAGREVRSVHHHHAHVAAVMGEHGIDPSESVLGIAFDGTGYGTDRAIWGGEIMHCRYKSCQRLAHLSYVPLAGGDVSVTRPYRMALAHLWSAGIEWSPRLPAVAACPESERRALAHQLDTGLGCVPTSSMGRLFDAISALIGIRQIIDYEAQAAIELESVSRGIDCAGEHYRFGLATDNDTPATVIDPAPVLGAAVADLGAGVAPGTIGARFHVAVAAMVRDCVLRFAELSDTVALTGGVFQNALLFGMTRKLLADAGFEVIAHRLVPPNDGGVAFGQLLVASSG